ncbi:unnamed protein product [Camellia sinensis]
MISLSTWFRYEETQKFRDELLKKLYKDKDTFGDDLQIVVNVCTEIFGEFLHKEYAGPVTLLVEPFTDILVALKEKKLPGGPLAARASILWAQNDVDQNWEIWNSEPPKFKRFVYEKHLQMEITITTAISLHPQRCFGLENELKLSLGMKCMRT